MPWLEAMSVEGGGPHASGSAETADPHHPSKASQRGTVKWFNRAKGFGFVTTADGELFVGAAALSGGFTPSAGDAVDFEVADMDEFFDSLREQGAPAEGSLFSALPKVCKDCVVDSRVSRGRFSALLGVFERTSDVSWLNSSSHRQRGAVGGGKLPHGASQAST